MTDRSPDENPSPFRRPGWIISAALLVAVLVVAAVLLWPRGDSPEDDPTSPGTATTPSTATEPADPDASICGLEPGDQTVPTTAPADATWTLHGTFAAPTIDGIGPGLTDDDGLTHCFANSPTGAVLAAMNVVAMGQVDPASLVDERLAADTPERQALADEYATAPPTLTEGTGVQINGFGADVLSTGDVAVEVVFRGDNGQLVASLATMRWESGDWKLVVPPGGQAQTTALTSMAGYVEWRGV